jgi:hypothetical protein
VSLRLLSHGDPWIATLVRTVPVKLLDVSRSGCRLESGRALETGVCGQLVIELDGRLRMQDIRVARCQAREGTGSIYQVGAELLRTRRLTDRSVRMAVRRFIGEAVTSTGPGGAPLDNPAPAGMGRRDERDTAASRAPPAPAVTR